MENENIEFEGVLNELKTVFEEINARGGNGITKDNFSESTISTLELTLGRCPKFIEKEIILDVLNRLDTQTKNLREQKYSEIKPSLENHSPNSFSQENGSDARQDEELLTESIVKYDEICKMIKTKYQLRRVYLAYGLLGLYFQEKMNPEQYISKEEVEAFLHKTGLKKEKIKHIRWEIFGNGKAAKEYQAKLLEKNQFYDGERFKLKRQVFNFIDSLINEKSSEDIEEELRSQVVEFMYTFKNEEGTNPYKEIAYQIISEGIDEPLLEINWEALHNFNMQLSSQIINTPENVLPDFEYAFLNLLEDVHRQVDPNTEFSSSIATIEPPKIKVTNLPKTIRPKDINRKYIGKLVSIKGVVSVSGPVKSFFSTLAYLCPICGHEERTIQKPYKLIKPPKKCSECGGKKLEESTSSSEITDIQYFILQDNPEDIENENPRNIRCYLQGPLAGTITSGSKVKLTGILRIFESFDQKTSAIADPILEVQNIEFIDKEEVAKLSKADVEKIMELKDKYGDDLPNVIARSIAPHISGNLHIKKGLAMSIVGATKLWSDEFKRRENINVLLIGDPSTAKTNMILDIKNIAPKVIQAEGSSSTGVGLTASVEKDKFTGEFMVHAGALVLANGGILLIDELPTLRGETLDYLKTAMEQGIITINKASITNMTLNANTTIIATGNPIHGYIDDRTHIIEQLNISSPILTRFDLIFIIRDIADEEEDRKMAERVLNQTSSYGPTRMEIPIELLRKYFIFARNYIFPKFDDAINSMISEIYVGLREEIGRKSKIPLSPRFLETLMRLSYAHAKLRLAETVTEEDVKVALELIKNELENVFCDPDKGEIDMSIYELGYPSKKRELEEKVLETVKKKENLPKGAYIMDIVNNLTVNPKISVSEAEIYSTIRKLINKGTIIREGDYLRLLNYYEARNSNDKEAFK